MKKIDLHVHTTYSDGALDIATLLNVVKRRKIKTVSITDHETIIGLTGYKEARKQYNLDIIPGIEMNVDYPGMHILGYGVEDFEKVENVFDSIKKENEQVVYDTIKLLQKNGVFISLEDVNLAAKNYHDSRKKVIEVNSSIFKYNKKFILTKTDIARALVNLKYCRDIDDAYKKYIGSSCKNYIRTDKILTRDAIELISSCGGVCVLAHPMTANVKHTDLTSVCRKLKDYGLIGIEAYGARFNNKQTNSYLNIAKKLKLVVTAGSDFHRDGQILGIDANPSIVYKLRRYIKQK